MRDGGDAPARGLDPALLQPNEPAAAANCALSSWPLDLAGSRVMPGGRNGCG